MVLPDGNGRVGRIILFRECLYHNLIPAIVRNDNKVRYIRYLNAAQVCHEINGLTDYLKEEQEHYRAETMNMIFHYQEIAEIQKKKAKKVNIPHL